MVGPVPPLKLLPSPRAPGPAAGRRQCSNLPYGPTAPASGWKDPSFPRFSLHSPSIEGRSRHIHVSAALVIATEAAADGGVDDDEMIVLLTVLLMVLLMPPPLLLLLLLLLLSLLVEVAVLVWSLCA